MNYDEIMRKYGRKIEEQVASEQGADYSNISREYSQFKEDMMPNLSKYERWCQGLGNVLSLKIAEKDRVKIQKQLDVAHLDVSPSQTLTLAILSLLLTFFLGVLVSLLIFFYSGVFPFLFFFLIIISSLFLFYYSYSTPKRLANKWRLKASSQMVPCLLYVVVYMKHTSNLERAIAFASEHLSPPLALDFKKIFWDVETGKFSTIKESLDSYLESWRETNIEFIESFHLIESSLYESNDSRRVEILERALSVILDGVYEKMLRYSREIRAPLTNIYMLGIVLPTLALALLPLASTLLQGAIQWYHIFLLFNLIIPFFVYYLTGEVMLKRPGGYGETELLEMNPLYPKYKSKKPYLAAFLIVLPLVILGILPFIFQYTPIPEWMGMAKDFEINIDFFSGVKMFDFKEITVDGKNKIVGPFGPMALLLSLLIPLSIALFFSIAYKKKTRELILARDESKDLEKEFGSSLFQLGNRLGDGTPAEIAFSKVAESSRGMKTENFFRIVNENMQGLGMSLEEAIFNRKRGAIIYYPSNLIRTSMKILLESAKKGLRVAAASLMAISEYVKNIEKINERLRDLLAEVVSDMRSNMTFLAPLLSGIIVGLASMITMILGRLEFLLDSFGNMDVGSFGDIEGILELFNVAEMIPPYFLQIAVGIYIIQIIFILTLTLVTVDVGEDKLKQTHDTGKNLGRGLVLYLIVALFAIIALVFLAMFALSGLGG